MRKVTIPLLLLSFMLLLSLPLGAQEERKQEVEKIVKVSVTGNERIDTGFIMKNIRTKENESYSLDKIREDMKSIYKTGFFSDVQIDVQDSDKGKAVTFIVVERPPIKAIFLSGNKQIKTSDLREKVKIKTGTVLNTEKIKESMDEIKKHYASKGFYATRVSYEIDYEEGYEATLKFFIEEPEKAYVKKISFTGNKVFKDKALKDYMKTKEKGILSWFTGSGILDEEVLEDDRKNLEAFYFDNGYVRAMVGIPAVKLSDDQKSISVSIPVEEGNLYRVGSMDFTGDVLFSREQFFQNIKGRPGIIFKSSLFHADVLAVSDMYQDQGYAFCDVAPLTAIDDNTQRVNITYNITQGREIYFNRINILGNTKTRDKVVRRELVFAEGDRFSATKIQRSKRLLRNTTFFKDTDFKIVKTDEPDKVNVDLTVDERPTGTLSLGIGYSTVDRVILSGSVSQQNFLGTGRSITLTAAVSAFMTNIQFSFFEPYIFDKNLGAGFSLYNYKRIMDTYNYQKQGGNLSLVRPLTEDKTIRARTVYRLDNTVVTDIDQSASQFIFDQEGSKVTSSVLLGLGRNTIDDILNPSRGSNSDISFELAGGPFGGDNYFYRAIAFYGQYIPAGFWDSTFFLKATAGTIRPYGNKTVPIYENFFIGGLYNVRGFKYGEAGPKDSSGVVIGGRNALYFNTEWIFPIYKPAGVKGVLFYDAGGGFDENKGFVLKDSMHATAGFGIRWFSPMGPIRLEWGFNLFPKEGDRSNVFDFAIGTQY
jgi:outer membrane protein insertion porin family